MRAIAILLSLGLLLAVPAVQAESDTTTWFVNDFTATDGSGAFLSVEGPNGNAMTSTTLGIDPRVLTFSEREAGFPAGYTSNGGDGQAFAYVKSWNSLPAPQTTVEFTVKVGDTVVATGEQTKDVLNGAIVEFSITFPYEHGDIAAGDLISMTTRIVGPTDDGHPGFYPRGDSSNHWRVVLPVTGIAAEEGPEAIIEDLDVPEFEHVFENATTALYQFNFSVADTFGVLTFDVNGTGNATAILADATGMELYNGTVLAAEMELQNATAGNWTLHLDYQNFTGSLSFGFLSGAMLAEDIAPEETTEDNATAEPESIDDIAEDAQEAPGFQVAAILAGLAAIVLVRRK